MTALRFRQNGTVKNLCPYAVGDVYITFSATSPATRWADTTWELVAAGRFLVAGASSGTYTVGATGGAASHSHGVTGLWANICSHSGAIYWRPKAGISWQSTYFAGASGDPSGSTDRSETEAAGIGGSMDTVSNMPPWIAAYMWKRTGGGAVAI